jgi:diaminobutyrate-2-oxoglutarate transaminase
VRGKGLMLGSSFVKDNASKRRGQEVHAGFACACYRRGLLIEIGGHYNQVARFLPLVLAVELAAQGLAIFMDSVHRKMNADYDCPARKQQSGSGAR